VYEKLTHDSTTNWKDMPALDPLNVKEQRVNGMYCNKDARGIFS
jgi:hypothetical protein